MAILVPSFVSRHVRRVLFSYGGSQITIRLELHLRFVVFYRARQV